MRRWGNIVYLPTSMSSFRTKVQELKSNLILTMCFLYLIQFFVDSRYLDIFLTILVVVIFSICLFSVKPVPRLLGGGMFFVGITMNIIKGEGLGGIISGITTNLPLLTLIILVPLISIPFKIKGYFEATHYYIKKISHDSRKIFSGLTLFVFVIGPIMSVGAIRILHEMIRDLELKPKVLAKSYLVGYSTVVLWSPYHSSVALVIYYLDVSIMDYIPLALTFAVILLFLGNLIYWLSFRKSNKVSSEYEKFDNNDTKYIKSIRNMITTVLILFLTVFVLEYITKWSMMFLVSLISVLFLVIWCTLNKEWKKVSSFIKDFKENSVQKTNNEIVLFISAGIFGKTLTDTPVANGIKIFLNDVFSMSFLLFITMILLIMLSFTFVGIHQIVIATVLITQLDSPIVETSPEVLALIFMIGWSMSAVLSPVNPLNLLVSSLVKKPALSVGLKWNGFYLLVMFVVGSIFTYIIY